jgi:pimeloyl-ACP methyl ester carboxylesterase
MTLEPIIEPTLDSADDDELATGGVSRFVAAADGLRLHIRDYGGAAAGRSPVVCLPGLARTAADFDRLAMRLSAAGRRVAALDYRGRGRSNRDLDWRNYNLGVESADISKTLDELGISRGIFIGVSRGGLHIMALAAASSTLLDAAVLVDIGPVIETKGLERIRSYVGKLPAPTSWPAAVEMVQTILGPRFSGLAPEDVEAYARLTLKERNGAFVPRYDTRLTDHLAHMDLSKPLPATWEQYDALREIPLLAIRGENSDLLSPETFAAMAARHPGCETFTVPGQGHAPLLRDEPTLARIEAFVERVDPSDP